MTSTRLSTAGVGLFATAWWMANETAPLNSINRLTLIDEPSPPP